ncbi:MAG: RluA family pseudouridine synthase [Mariprofundaceae bacterium]
MINSPGVDHVLHIVIDADHHGQRVDHALALLSGLSRNRIQKLIAEGCVSDAPSASAHVSEGELYAITLPPPESLGLKAENIPLDILHEDEHLLVVNKPAGMVVHPGAGHASGTLVHALLHHCPNLPGINGVERPGIIHRLDKDTSGSLVVAKSEAAHVRMVEMFSQHDIDRQYVAWCRGSPSWRHQRIDLAIGRHPRHRQKMHVLERGKTAVTDVEVEHRYDGFCRLRLTLHTGRTHQIRVHLSHIGLPIIGDAVYARRFKAGKHVPEPAVSAINSMSRQALHAEVLGFTHPVTNENVRCTAPWPADLRQLSEAFEKSYA